MILYAIFPGMAFWVQLNCDRPTDHADQRDHAPHGAPSVPDGARWCPSRLYIPTYPLFPIPYPLFLRCLKCLIQIGLDILDVFQTDADADVVVGYAGGLEFLGRLLAVGSAGRMDDQGFGVADIGQMRGQFDRLDKFPRGRVAAFHAESQNRAAAAGQVFFRHFMIRMRGQARIVDPSDQRVRLQKSGHGQGVFAMPRHAQMKRFQTLQE